MMIALGHGASLLVALSFVAGAISVQLMEKKSLTLALAKQIAAAAETEAVSNKFKMVIAIVDDGGHLIYLQRMDETQIASVEIARQKAHTALAFKRPTKTLEDAVAGGRIVIMTLPGAVTVEGGIPLTHDGKIIGAIGVSGGTSPEDGIVAKAGVNALEKILNR